MTKFQGEAVKETFRERRKDLDSLYSPSAALRGRTSSPWTVSD